MIGSSYMVGSSVPEPGAKDSELRLLVPANDVADPELSIVIPALNEELTIGQFVDWCQEGLRRAKVRGDVLIIDSSTDTTAEVALAQGARVLKAPKRGLGRAYIDAIPFIRGDYVLMGDADCTYDFRNLEPFMAKFHDGYEYVMGSRFRGYIEPGSMPALHRYFGTPVTTLLLNLLYGSRFSDIHCGMRGISREYFRTGRHCAPTTGSRVTGVANGTVVHVVQAGERQATRWAHLYLRYRVRRGNMSRGSCYRARRQPPWIVRPLTRSSLAGAARSWPIIEAQSTRCSARQDFAPY